jgi:23S rRNA pseudouridine2605 synthase
MPRDDDKTRSRPPGRRGPPRERDGARGDRPKRPFKERGEGDRRSGPGGERRSARPAGKSFGERKSGPRDFGDRKPAGRDFGDRKPRGDKPFRDKPYGDRPRDDSRGERKSYGSKPGGLGKRRDDGERRPYNRDRSDAPRGDRPFRDKPYGDRPRGERPAGKSFGERKSGPRDFGDRKPAGRDFGDRKPRGDKPFRDKPYGDRPRDDGRGERKSFGGPRRDDGERRSYNRDRNDKPRGERRDGPRDARPAGRSFGERKSGPRDFGDRKPDSRDFGDRKPRGDRPFKDKPYGDRPRDDSRGERKSFGGKSADRSFGDKRRGGGGRSSFGRGRDDQRFERSESDRPARPRRDEPRRTSHVWREHPRSEEGDDGFETRERTYEKRPAFGGRGAYRERGSDDRSSRRREAEAPAAPKKEGERIAKVLARAGLCSRRDAEAWIADGRVAVNGRVITSPALDVTSRDTVMVDGAPLPERERTRLFLYHKPRGLVTTHSDPEGRPTVFESLPGDLPRLISIGRLDFNTEGLLLLTNDGGLARTLELPDTGWLRRYRVRAHGAITQEKLDELRNGVEVDGVKYGPVEATLERDQGANSWMLFAIREGKNREVRNILAHLGLEVNRLIRVSYGPFQLGELPEGEVEEVRSRMLRDQLGEKIAKAANVDFKLPKDTEEEASSERPRKREVIADRKGRRVMVERSADADESEARPPRAPRGGSYKGRRDRPGRG